MEQNYEKLQIRCYFLSNIQTLPTLLQSEGGQQNRFLRADNESIMR